MRMISQFAGFFVNVFWLWLMKMRRSCIIFGWVMRHTSTCLDVSTNRIFVTGATPTLVNSISNLFIHLRLLFGVPFLRQALSDHFFENERGEAVTVNAERYSVMLRTFLFPQLPQYDLNDETLFQQDGATSHTARVSMHLLNDVFPNRLISRNGPIPWPPRSPDLSACDFFCGATWKVKCTSNGRPHWINWKKTFVERLQEYRNKCYGTSWPISIGALTNVWWEKDVTLPT